MSSKFANCRKPRKVGGDDEEEDGGAAPGMWATVTFFSTLDIRLPKSQLT